MPLSSFLLKASSFTRDAGQATLHPLDRMGRITIGESKDLRRILDVPRRPVPSREEQKRMAAVMTEKLRRHNKVCRCAELRPGQRSPCITELMPVQGWYLYEAQNGGGALGHIVAGGGKTGINFLLPMVFPNCKRAVLLIEPKLIKQTLLDYELWRQHFHVPNLKGGNAPFLPTLPVLDILSYSKLSHKSCTSYLIDEKPDLIIADEAHNLKNPAGVRGGRFLWYYDEAEKAGQRAAFCGHSGTMTTDSPMDYGHLSALALAENSPLPLDPVELSLWSACLAPPRWSSGPPPNPGALNQLTQDGENIRQGYCRRLIETPGVITTEDAQLPTKLVLRSRSPGDVPARLNEYIKAARKEGHTPGDDPLENPAEVAACCAQLVCGFYYHTVFTRGEPEELIAKWYNARKKWNRELRAKMEESRLPMLDAPELLAEAAERAATGYTGPLPVWYSRNWVEWRDIQRQVVPEQTTVWLDDYLVNDAIHWAKENGPGVIWYNHTAFAYRLAEVSGFPLYEGGTNPESDERGDRTIICSIDAHATGKNMQQWCRALIANPQGRWEQLLARHHRKGQSADEVIVDVYTHTTEFEKPLVEAIERAHAVQETTRKPERLVYADKTLLTL